VSVGNDVVDLADPETRLSGLHPRFDERVFCVAERAALEASRSRHLLHWALWAAKESAYKAQKRLEPETVFSPKEFEVELSPLPAADGAAVGRVVHRGDVFDLKVRLVGAVVHAVATSEDEADARVLWTTEDAQGDPGVAARRLAASSIGSALGLDPADLRIVGRPPVATFRDRRFELGVSLSHHGRFVAFACTLAGFSSGLSGVCPGSGSNRHELSLTAF
jgi:4'-phosphopantetheinyl transferase superfamily